MPSFRHELLALPALRCVAQAQELVPARYPDRPVGIDQQVAHVLEVLRVEGARRSIARDEHRAIRVVEQPETSTPRIEGHAAALVVEAGLAKEPSIVL